MVVIVSSLGTCSGGLSPVLYLKCISSSGGRQTLPIQPGKHAYSLRVHLKRLPLRLRQSHPRPPMQVRHIKVQPPLVGVQGRLHIMIAGLVEVLPGQVLHDRGQVRFLRQVPGRVRGARVDSGRIIAHASLLLCGVGCSGPRVSGGGAGCNPPPPGQLIAAWWASMIANSKAMTSALVMPASSSSWALALRSTLLEPSITRAANSASSAFMVSSLGTLSGASPPCGVPQAYIIPEGKANPSPPRATR